jgi:hypothetical protein
MVDFPAVAMPENTLFLVIGLFLQALMEVESTKEIPVHSPKQHVFKNTVIGRQTLFASSTNRSYDKVLENTFCICFWT